MLIWRFNVCQVGEKCSTLNQNFQIIAPIIFNLVFLCPAVLNTFSVFGITKHSFMIRQSPVGDIRYPRKGVKNFP